MSLCRIHTRATVVLILSLLIIGCGYPELSPKAYDCAKALYSVCNQKDSERLDQIAIAVRDAETARTLGAAEADWLRDIIETARTAQWSEAAAEARKMMMDQIIEP